MTDGHISTLPEHMRRRRGSSRWQFMFSKSLRGSQSPLVFLGVFFCLENKTTHEEINPFLSSDRAYDSKHTIL